MAYEIFVSDVVGTGDRLNGVILTAKIDNMLNPVNGLTLKIDAATITFGSDMSADQIVAAINSGYGSNIVQKRGVQNAPAVTSGPDGKMHVQVVLAFQKDAGFTVQSDGTANPVFGFSTTTDTVSAGAVPSGKVLGFTQGTSAGNLATIIDLS